MTTVVTTAATTTAKTTTRAATTTTTYIHAPSTSEMRGVWVSYLDLDALLDGADATAAKARLDGVFDTCAAKKLNTVFFHVRSHSNAYYASTVFPSAKTATNLLAQNFDPLAYAVDAAHKRGLELHAWINPYRVGKDKVNAVCDDIFEQDGVWYYNPAADSARKAVLDGVREVLDRYAVDGIHFDDYFYPTAIPKTAQPFEQVPDDMTVGDWRRAQVDTLVSAVHGLTRARGKAFGISPTATPQKDRDKAYADTAMWLRQTGYVDYLCPQIYFGFMNETQPFDTTLATWESLPRHSGAKLYIGLALYKSGTPDSYAGSGKAEWCTQNDILARQVTAMRASGKCDGFVLFRYANVLTAENEVKNLQTVL